MLRPNDPDLSRVRGKVFDLAKPLNLSSGAALRQTVTLHALRFCLVCSHVSRQSILDRQVDSVRAALKGLGDELRYVNPLVSALLGGEAFGEYLLLSNVYDFGDEDFRQKYGFAKT